MRRMIRNALWFVVLIAAIPGQAGEPTKPPPGGMILSADGHATLSADVCAGLTPSVPGAEYVPGVDVEGRSVAPADLPGPAPLPIKNLAITLRHGTAVAGGHGNGSIIGLVTVRDGRAYFNDAPLAADDQAAMAAACRGAKH